eukprot:CCRYP_012373-RG/>CCRYP_012373-RG protein AED:0.05 eAED:0.05 QI:4461/1/1/1/0.36/0.25/12/996/975
MIVDLSSKMLASEDLAAVTMEVTSDESSAKQTTGSFDFERINGQDNGTKQLKFPAFGDFPLESEDEVVGVLKKRSRSPETGDLSNKKSACANGNPKLGVLGEPEYSLSEGLKADFAPVANLHLCQTKEDNKEPDSDDVHPKFIHRLTCDVFKSSSSETLAHARNHESRSKIKEDLCDRSDQMKEAANALTSFALSSVSTSTSTSSDSVATSNEEEEPLSHSTRDPPVDLVPKENDTTMLSDYNNLLVRHIEFFYPARSHLNYDNLSGSKNSTNMSNIRLGLRCVHCKTNPTHVTAAAFFPSAVSSIASGLGTIGSRHFGWGKCPNADPEVVHQMIETKKNSSLQTRTNGRIGLDAYCKNLANQYGIFDDELSGVCLVESKQGNPSLALRESHSVDRSSVASVLAGMRHDTNIDVRPYVPSEMNCFWECSKCRSVPIQFRSKGSVIFSVEEPTAEMIEDHVKICNGIQALLVPRTATIEPFYGDYEDTSLPLIRVRWENSEANAKTSSRRRSEDENTIKRGVDEDPLCFDADKPYTTDFAYFTVKQLKRCYLTKPGGSRGACPIGYAGLACGHCAGGNTERRFFYTSADHLRNSFSHIPSHLMECSSCPDEVKTRLEELKGVRNRQKSQLKVGHHKIFIDRLWSRLHDGLPVAVSDNNEDESSASQRTSAFSTAIFSRNGSSETIKATSSALVQDADRSLTSDLAFFTLLQVAPYKMLGGSNSDDSDSREIGFPGLICLHCNNTPNGRKFFTTSSVHLSGLLVTISNHMQTCQGCPKSVRNQITRFKSTHESQLQLVSTDDHARCMQRVWERLVKASQSKEKKSRKVYQPVEGEENVRYLPVDQSKPLVTPEDEQLVTPYTYLVMKQVRPCNLGTTGNGSRSQFADGFPGLECIHCADTSNSRKFFYRTVDILSGNYAHIPNHLVGCAKCPADVKAELADKKEHHLATKSRLDRGSQRKFFQNIWDRLHAGKQVQN